jgi:hypothetical protein
VLRFVLHPPGCCGPPTPVVVDQPAPAATCGLKELPPPPGPAAEFEWVPDEEGAGDGMAQEEGGGDPNQGVATPG